MRRVDGRDLSLFLGCFLRAVVSFVQGGDGVRMRWVPSMVNFLIGEGVVLGVALVWLAWPSGLSGCGLSDVPLFGIELSVWWESSFWTLILVTRLVNCSVLVHGGQRRTESETSEELDIR